MRLPKCLVEAGAAFMKCTMMSGSSMTTVLTAHCLLSECNLQKDCIIILITLFEAKAICLFFFDDSMIFKYYTRSVAPAEILNHALMTLLGKAQCFLVVK